MAREIPLDYDRMERDIASNGKMQIAESTDYSPLQGIAHAITKLTWKEAEQMGLAIRTKTTAGDGESLTAAIQSWAAEWETFK